MILMTANKLQLVAVVQGLQLACQMSFGATAGSSIFNAAAVEIIEEMRTALPPTHLSSTLPLPYLSTCTESTLARASSAVSTSCAVASQ